MHSAFGVDHGEIAKAMSPNKLAGLKAASKGSYGNVRARYATDRLKMHEFGQAKARLGGKKRPENFYNTGPHMRQANKKDLRIAQGGPWDKSQSVKPVGMRGSLTERMKRGLKNTNRGQW